MRESTRFSLDESIDTPRQLVEVILGPAIWLVHFALSYATAAVWCAKHGRDATLRAPRIAVVVYTCAALTLYVVLMARAYGAHRRSGGQVPHDEDTARDRSGFLGFLALILAGLSAIGTIFVALAAWFTETCR